MKKSIVPSVAIFVLLAFVGTSSGVEIPLLEPALQCVRTEGKPNVCSGEFPGVPGQGMLIIENGDGNGNRRISSAVITLNGAVVSRTEDFNKSVDSLEIPVELVQNNTISLEMRSGPGCYLIAQVTQEISAEAGAVVGPPGGIVAVTDPTSTIYGARVEVPEGALDEEAIISIGLGETMGDMELIGIPLLLRPDGLTFQREVEVVFPLSEPLTSDEILMLMLLNTATNAYEYAGKIIQANTGAIFVRIGINHFSSYSLKRFTSTIPKVSSVIDFFQTLSLIKEAHDANNCVELSAIKDLLLNKQDAYWNTMQAFIDGFQWCTTRPPCDNVKEVGDALLEIFSGIGKHFAIKLFGKWLAELGKPVAEQWIGAISALITAFEIGQYTGCALCLIHHSIANPEFQIAFLGYNISEYGIQLISNPDSDGDGIRDACDYPNKIISSIDTTYSAVSGVYLNSDDSRLYAAYWRDDYQSPVEEYDLSDNSLIQTITFGSYHTHGDVVLSADDRYLFTSNYYYGNISRIDLKGGNARTDLYVGSTWPADIDITPDKSKILVEVGMDGRDYDMNNDQITIVDVASYSILEQVVLNDEPYHKVGFSSDSTKAYVAANRRKSASHMLYEVSLEPPYRVLRSAPLPGPSSSRSDWAKWGVAVTDSQVYVSDSRHGEILIFDLATFTEKSPIYVGGSPVTLAITPNEKYLYALNEDGTASVIDVSADTIVETIPGFAENPFDIEFTKDGSKAYISHRSEYVYEITVLSR